MPNSPIIPVYIPKLFFGNKKQAGGEKRKKKSAAPRGGRRGNKTLSFSKSINPLQ